jgi:predicted enzyme related to lactoylglutathione lyase
VRERAAGLLVNIDVPDLARGIGFYRDGFGLAVSRYLGRHAAELTGWPVPLYLLENPGGSVAAAAETRRYARHWTPVHLDVVVADLDAAVHRALAAGATLERPLTTAAWGSIVGLADPFGHGVCLVAFTDRGYDAIATAGPMS